MDRELIIQKFATLGIWRRAGERAPHKPLLVLYAIGKLLRGESRLIPYCEVDEELGKLLQEFGPRRLRQGSQYPFWRLRNDGVWEITDADQIVPNASGDARKSELLARSVSGGFRERIAMQLQNPIIHRQISSAGTLERCSKERIANCEPVEICPLRNCTLRRFSLAVMGSYLKPTGFLFHAAFFMFKCRVCWSCCWAICQAKFRFKVKALPGPWAGISR